MPMMFRFAEQRRELLRAEFLRIAGELPALGAIRFWPAGDLAEEHVGPGSELEIVLIQETDLPFHRRADFFTSHLRPTVGTRFLVYTPDEADALADDDRLLARAIQLGDAVQA